MLRVLKSLLKSLATAAVLGYGSLCALLYFSQDSLLYYPTAESNAGAAEALTLSNGDVRLKVWRAGEGADAVLYFGGNAEDVSNNISRFATLYPAHTVYLMNYRGFSGSSGELDEAGFYSDAAALYDFANARHARVSVIGRSLGSGVATWLAAERPVERLVLVTPYDSVENIARDNYPYAPVSLLLRDKYRSIDRVERIKAPVLILVAEVDRVIPLRNSMALAEKFPPAQVRVRKIDDSDHRSIARSPAYALSIRHFLLQENRRSADNTQTTRLSRYPHANQYTSLLAPRPDGFRSVVNDDTYAEFP